MKILVVDDDNNKAESIRNVILQEKIGKSDIRIVASITDAVSELMKEKYNLMILDMMLPDTFGSTLRQNGGLELLEVIEKNEKLIPPAMAVILTAHENLIQQFQEVIKKVPFDVVCYNSSSDEWRQKICKQVRYQIRCEDAPEEKRQYKYDLAILTAVPVEKEAVYRLADKWDRICVDGDSTVYWGTEWVKQKKTCKVVWTCLPQMGMVAAATAASKLIFNFIPRYMIMPGIAAGIKAEYEYGDLIIPKEVKDYCSGKYTTPDKVSKSITSNPLKYFVPSSSSLPTDPFIFNKMVDSYQDELIRIHSRWPFYEKYKIPHIRTGYIASGDSVIQNSVIVDIMIKNHLKNADGIDMEAYGMYYAASQAIKPQPICVCMKAVSDFANREKSDEHQPYAAYVSANFMKYFMMQELFS